MYKKNSIGIKQINIDMLVLEIHTQNINKFIEDLDKKINQSPCFFKNLSIVLNIKNMEQSEENLNTIIEEITKRKVKINGILSSNKKAIEIASKKSINIITAKPTKQIQQNTNEVIFKNIRSGQQIKALDKNIIIFGNVNSGAEIIAGGSVTIYGSLKGRVEAGLNSQQESFVVVTKELHPELISINNKKYISDKIKVPEDTGSKYIYLNESNINIKTF